MRGLYFAVITDFKLELTACDILWGFLCNTTCPLLRFKISFSDFGNYEILAVQKNLQMK